MAEGQVGHEIQPTAEAAGATQPGLPAPLLKFLKEQGINPDVYERADGLPRYLR